jgi:hypothetical protein
MESMIFRNKKLVSFILFIPLEFEYLYQCAGKYFPAKAGKKTSGECVMRCGHEKLNHSKCDQQNDRKNHIFIKPR